MKQIYRFDSSNSPVLSERTLRIELERRKLRQQTTILAVAGNLTIWCMIAAGLLLQPVSVILSISCVAYACVAICGGAVIAIVFAEKRRIFTWNLHSYLD